MPDEPQVTEETQADEGGDELAALQAERDELFDRLQRLAAEFDNYRKRSARDAAALSERANERLGKGVLPLPADLAGGPQGWGRHEGAKAQDGVRALHSLARPLVR